MKKYYDYEKRIKAQREAKKITQKQILDLFKENSYEKITTIVTLSKIENGRTSYTEEAARLLSKFFNIDYKYLIYETDYTSYEDMLLNKADIRIQQDYTLYNFLDSHGYKKGASVKRIYSDKCPIGIKELNEKYPDSIIPRAYCDNIYEIITPKGEKKYIKESVLEQLADDFYTLLQSRLLDAIPE